MPSLEERDHYRRARSIFNNTSGLEDFFDAMRTSDIELRERLYGDATRALSDFRKTLRTQEELGAVFHAFDMIFYGLWKEPHYAERIKEERAQISTAQATVVAAATQCVREALDEEIRQLEAR